MRMYGPEELSVEVGLEGAKGGRDSGTAATVNVVQRLM